ncbi:MAG: hypothetical protein K2N44_19505 [Lachnospiraceae bacterium]|nr:hypothetical protein [Lachnospiraceae bacterium]
MKKLTKVWLFIIAAVCLLAGVYLFSCPKIQLPQNPRVYEQKNHRDKYAYLVYEDKMFVPYCPFEAKYLGECIGYYDVPASDYSDANRVYVCELYGYSSDEWIVDIMDTNCSEGMIWKEINAADIPEGLTSEYEWNQ